MRAIYYPDSNDLQVGERVLISKDRAHHLINVIRVQVGEELLLLDGRGKLIHSKVIMVSKREVDLEVQSVEIKVPSAGEISLAIAVIKKDYLEDVFKMATELGVRKITLLKTAYSQSYSFSSERVERVLESALIQSNNPYMPEIEGPLTLTEFLTRDSGEIILFDLKESDKRAKLKGKKITYLVGPEGGFDASERTLLQSDNRVSVIRLETPILKAVTAVPTCFGYLLSKMS